jgi:predicted dehydrogenase
VLRHRPCNEVLELASGCFDKLEDACAFQPQASIVANPAPFHVDAAIALMAAGSHVLVEKPLAQTTDGIRVLLSAVRKHQRLLQVGYNLRFLSSLQKFKELIHEGVVGKVLSVRCEVGQYLPSWRPEADYRQGVSARKDLGGGVLLELSHELDYLRWIFGEVVWVSAWTGKQSSLEIDVEDSAHLTLGFATGLAERCLVGTLNLDCIRHDKIRECEAIGEMGSLRWNGLTGDIESWMAGQKHWVRLCGFSHQRDDTYRLQWWHFMDCIKSGNSPMVGAEDGLAVLRIIDAARESAYGSGSRVDITSGE